MSVDRHLLALRQSVAALRRHADVSPRRLLLDASLRRSVERGLQLCARSIAELTHHVGPAAHRNPAAYPSSIEFLVAANVLPPDLGERLRPFTAAGEALERGASRLGRREMARVLAEHLDDFDELASHVERWLARQ